MSNVVCRVRVCVTYYRTCYSQSWQSNQDGCLLIVAHGTGAVLRLTKATLTITMRCIVPFLACVLLVAVSCTTAQNNKQLPVVLWHGMGDSCCNNHSIGSLANLIREQLGMKHQPRVVHLHPSAIFIPASTTVVQVCTFTALQLAPRNPKTFGRATLAASTIK